MKKTNRDMVIILLAYVHHYLYPTLIIVIACMFGRNVLLMGIGLFLLAAYDLIGYKCGWKHIFCSIQLYHCKKMTPNSIDWSSVKKSDAYGIPAALGIMGIAMIFCYFLCA